MKSPKVLVMVKAKKKVIELLIAVVVIAVRTLRIIFIAVFFIGRTTFILMAIKLKKYLRADYHFIKDNVLMNNHTICGYLNHLIVSYSFSLIKRKIKSLLINLIEMINLNVDMIDLSDYKISLNIYKLIIYIVNIHKQEILTFLIQLIYFFKKSFTHFFIFLY